MQSLVSICRTLGVDDVLPVKLLDRSTTNPVDIYRAHLSKLLEGLTGAQPTIIYSAIQTTQALSKGDLSLAVPALRLKGRNPDELAQKIQNEVISTPSARALPRSKD
jgi:arginyl-tRNA synthetase